MTPSAVLVGVLVGVFGLSGALKLVSGAAFDRFLRANLSERAARVLRVGVPVVELVAAVALLTPFVRFGAVLGVGLAIIFVVVSVVGRADDSAPSCGCFGALDAKTPHWLVKLRASALLGATSVNLIVVLNGTVTSRPVYSMAVGVAMGAAGASAISLAGQVISILRALRSTLAVDADPLPRETR